MPPASRSADAGTDGRRRDPPSLATGSRAAAQRGIESEEVDVYADGELSFPAGYRPTLTGEIWEVTIICNDKRRILDITLDKGAITFVNLSHFREQLGYSSRDFCYYKRRCGTDEATLEFVDTGREIEDMVAEVSNTKERKLRLILSKEYQPEGERVDITPLKRPREIQPDDDEEDDTIGFDESINEYKDWLRDLVRDEDSRDLHDDFRKDTIKTYTEWLREEGKLREISAYQAYIKSRRPTAAREESNGSSESPPSEWPSHARKQKKQTEGGKEVGRGTLKGLAAMAKRMKNKQKKLKVEFSQNLSGPCGENRRTFVDEVVMFMRINTPLIGVRYWKDVKPNVKSAIIEKVMDAWDIENNEETREKILKIAHERYKGWRSTLSATYKAYPTYELRMKHLPTDLDIVEWHYLNMYFGSRKFKKVSRRNSSNRQQVKVLHVMGSKPFSQCSWEKRDPETGVEPGQMELFKTTHSKQGEWSSEMSQSIYNAAARKLSLEESDDSGEQESRCTSVPTAKEDLAFQDAYKEATGTKSTKSHGKGYLSNPTKNQLLKERIKEQEREVQILKEQLAKAAADKEADKASLKAEIMEEMKAMMAQNMRQELTHETNNTTQNEARSPEENNDVTPMRGQETPNQIEPTSMVTTDRENVNPNCNTRAASKVSKNLFIDNRLNGPPAKFITSQQLLSGAKTRASKRKQDSQA